MILRERRLRGVARDCSVLRFIRYFSATFSTCPFLESRIAENLSPPRETGRIEARQAGSLAKSKGSRRVFHDRPQCQRATIDSRYHPC